MKNKKQYVVPVLALASGIAVAGDSTDARITALENQVEMLKSQVSSSVMDQVTVNGFLSLGATRASNDVGYADSDGSYEFKSLSLLGLQAEFALADETSVVTQLMARGSDDYDPEFEWAYLKHTFDNYITARAGKLRVPLFMYSDYIDVGFAQPWSRPPEEVYGSVPFSAYHGGDVAYDLEFDESTLSMQAFAGQAELSGIEFDYMYGASAGWSYEDWLLRVVYGSAKITAPTGSGLETILDNSPAGFYGLGVRYDDGTLLFVSELTRVEVDGAYSDTDSAYATVGRRYGDWMPYISIATMRTTDNSERETGTVTVGTTTLPLSLLANAEHDAYSLGVRYELRPNIALKADVTKIDGFGDTTGFVNDSLPGNNIYRTEDDSVIYSVRLDCVF